MGDFVVCFPSTWPTISIFEDCLRLTISPFGIPIVSPSVSSTSSASLLVILASVLLVYLVIPSYLLIIISGIILSCINDLACEVGNVFVCGRLCCFHLSYMILQSFDCILICSWLVCIIGKGLYSLIFNHMNVILHLDHKIRITAISGGLVWVSCLFEYPLKMNFKIRPGFVQLGLPSKVSAIVIVETTLVYNVKAYWYCLHWIVRILRRYIIDAVLNLLN